MEIVLSGQGWEQASAGVAMQIEPQTLFTYDDTSSS